MGAAQATGVLAMIEERSRQRKGEEIDPETHEQILGAVRASYNEQQDIRHGAARGWVDRLIDPAKTRDELIAALEAAQQGWDYSKGVQDGCAAGMKERIVQLDLGAIRAVSKRRCQLAGFTFAKSMPQRTAEECLLRPADEIVNRTHALLLLILFVCDSEEGSSTAEILEDLDRYRLWRHLTVGETDVFGLDRMQASNEYADVIGWQMENVWPLAWYLGFETEPRIDGVMIHDEINDIRTFSPPCASASPQNSRPTRTASACAPPGSRCSMTADRGHEVCTARRVAAPGSGRGSPPTSEYAAAGATIVDPPPTSLWDRAELVVKVKDPQPEEFERMREGQVVFGSFHFAADRALTEAALHAAGSRRSPTRR
jgi:hypothetical protein